MVLTLIMAVTVGGAFTFNSFTIQYNINNGFNLSQASQDANCMLFFPVFTLYWKELLVDDFPYTVKDTILSGMTMVLITLGVVSFSYAIQFGTAAAVQAVENTKAIVQMILGIIILGLIPNLYQIVGLISGLIGVLCIVCQSKGSDEKKNEEDNKDNELIENKDIDVLDDSAEIPK